MILRGKRAAFSVTIFLDIYGIHCRKGGGAWPVPMSARGGRGPVSSIPCLPCLLCSDYVGTYVQSIENILKQCVTKMSFLSNLI